MKLASLLLGASLAVPASFAMAQQFNAFTPPPVNGQGGIVGTGVGGEGLTPPTSRITTRNTFQRLGFSHQGAGTGGTGNGIGNAVGGINNLAVNVGTGGIKDFLTYGSRTGGLLGNGRSLPVGSGGLRDNIYDGAFLGGINGTVLGAGTGGVKDLISLGATTGGMNDNNAPRFWIRYNNN